MTLTSGAGAGNCVSIISLETNPTPPSHISGGCRVYCIQNQHENTFKQKIQSK